MRFFIIYTTRTKFKILLAGKKTKSNDGFGFCQNVTFEDDEFKDNKALNDQGKGEGTNCHSPTHNHH